MEIRYSLKYLEAVFREDLPKIDRVNQKRINKAIEERLMTFPERYGRPLRSPLQGFWKLRVGDYRVIFAMQAQEVRIVVIQHRSVVYSDSLKNRL